MRGVLTEADLKVYAGTALFFAPMAVVIDDGHAFPYASSFFWPDESPGLLVRLAEDDLQFPTTVEMTHVASGRKVVMDIPTDGFLNSIIRAGNFFYKEFDTQEAMLQSTSSWTNAICNNANPGDKYVTTWVKLPVTSPLIDNGTDILTTAGGIKVMRLTVREYLEPVNVVSTGTVTYAISTMQAFPTIGDAQASNIDSTYVLVTNKSGEHKIFKKDPTNDESGVEEVDWFKNAVGIHYNTR